MKYVIILSVEQRNSKLLKERIDVKLLLEQNVIVCIVLLSNEDVNNKE